MYREAADPPGGYSPGNNKKALSMNEKEQWVSYAGKPTRMNVLLTSPVLLVLPSSSLATSVNSLVKKMSSGITGIYTRETQHVQSHVTVVLK